MQHLEGRDARRAPRADEGPTAARPGTEDRDRDRRRTRQGASRGDHAPRRQARQHHADEDGRGFDERTAREAARLRAGEAARTGGADLDVRDDAARDAERLRRATGTILGTVQYMAPEQVEGREADARSDIWALGAVIYEMVTGTRPFRGDSPASIIGSILKDTPPPISARQPLSPPALDHIVNRCLDKDPEERWQSAADLMRELRWIDRPAPANRRRRVPAIVVRPLVRRLGWVVAAGLALAVCLRFGGPGVARSHVATDAPSLRLSVLPPPNIADSRARRRQSVPTRSSRVSRRRASARVRGASGEVGTRRLLGPAARTAWRRSSLPAPRVRDTRSGRPTGESIAFFAQGKLKRMDVAGGPVQLVMRRRQPATGGTWGAAATSSCSRSMTSIGLFRVSASTEVCRRQ